MAHIEKRRRAGRDGEPGPVHYRVRYRDADGKERSQSFRRLEDARKFAVKTESSLIAGTWIDPDAGRITFAEAIEEWLRSKPRKRQTTAARDRGVLKTHAEQLIGDMQLAKIRPSHVQTVVDEMVAKGLAPKTVATNYGVLRAVLSWAVKDDRIGRSPCRNINLPGVAKASKRNATAEEIRTLVDAVPVDYRVAVLLGAMGLRLAEVVGLRVGAIDFLRRTVTVEATINEVDGRFVDGDGKTESARRTIKLPRSVIAELSAHLARAKRTEPDDLVVQAPKGGPLRASNFRTRVYDKAVEKAGLDGLTFHRLRHSAGALMRERGVPLEVIQQRLGHRSIRTTADVYGSLPESIDSKVADDLDDILTGSGPSAAHEDQPEVGEGGAHPL